MSTLAQDIADRTTEAGRTPEQQAAYERIMGTAETVNEQREAGIVARKVTSDAHWDAIISVGSGMPKVAPAYIQVNIGRNVDGKPMPASSWAMFQSEVASAMRNAIMGRGIVSEHTGRGAWLDSYGVVDSEDSAYISTFALVDVDALRTALAHLRTAYGQDAIALIVGSELI